jgi:hypothetical protein
MAKKYGEQPNDAHHGRLIGKLDPELSKVDLALAAGRGLETALEKLQARGAHLSVVRDCRIAARISRISRRRRRPDRSGYAWMRSSR